MSPIPAVGDLFARIGWEHARFELLVNNTDVFEAEPLAAVTVEQFKRLFDINVLGVLLACSAAVPLLEQAGGSIINIGSLSGAWPRRAERLPGD